MNWTKMPIMQSSLKYLILSFHIINEHLNERNAFLFKLIKISKRSKSSNKFLFNKLFQNSTFSTESYFKSNIINKYNLNKNESKLINSLRDNSETLIISTSQNSSNSQKSPNTTNFSKYEISIVDSLSLINDIKTYVSNSNKEKTHVNNVNTQEGKLNQNQESDQTNDINKKRKPDWNVRILMIIALIFGIYVGHWIHGNDISHDSQSDKSEETSQSNEIVLDTDKSSKS